jgi:hypothetical protein
MSAVVFISASQMHHLKDIAARMDCHVRTAKRWWKKLRVPPDVIGHGPHRWHDDTADRLIHLWETYYRMRGTTPQIVRTKYAGKLTDKFQLELLTWNNEKSNSAGQNARTKKARSARGVETSLAS